MLAVLLGVGLAGCGGGGGGSRPEAARTVRGSGFVFSTPADWEVSRSQVGVSVSPQKGSQTTVAVTVFRLIRPFRPALWKRASGELDGVADRLARQLHGTVQKRSTVRVALVRARQYELSYERDGTPLRQRITFALRGRREYELLCRWSAGDGEPGACGLLTSSFRFS